MFQRRGPRVQSSEDGSFQNFRINRNFRTGRRRVFRTGGFRNPINIRRGPSNRVLQRQINFVKKTINKSIETKVVTGAMNMGLVAATPQYFSVSPMARGTTNNTRIGDKISIETLAFRGQIAVGDGETIGANVRVVLLLDRNPQGAQNVWNGGFFQTDNIYSLMNNASAFRGQFVKLWDQTFTLSTTEEQFKNFKGFVKINKEVLYATNVGDITDVEKGNLFFAAYAVGNDANVELTSEVRMRYVDA